MLVSLLGYHEDGQVDQATIVPMVDGGTEGELPTLTLTLTPHSLPHPSTLTLTLAFSHYMHNTLQDLDRIFCVATPLQVSRGMRGLSSQE